MRSGRAELEAVTEALKAGPDVIIAGGGWGTRIWPVRPEGNTTGIRILASELDGKRQELLMEMLPDARRIGALADVNTSGPEHLRTLEDDARSRGVELSAYLVDRQFDTTRARVILQGPQVLWPRGVDVRQRPDATRIGQHLHQKFLPLTVELGGQDTYPGRVAFRVSKRLHEVFSDEIVEKVTIGMVRVALCHIRVPHPPPAMMTSGPAFRASVTAASVFEKGTSCAPTFKRFTPST